jgi:hypothetical protein
MQFRCTPTTSSIWWAPRQNLHRQVNGKNRVALFEQAAHLKNGSGRG